ncbi:hypothetical protein [Flavivirga rizhaonensis]|uniref:Uncharacterized protein n=1 Tax=Flavivirga rizhaonensis TaxID=2559571 RepID=A0A4S1DSM5_9FLAO|nr:hypothetical protein [Flavivirga rizhaonensis]TGV00388.1 hypothetical protein EM932_19880 [Flavivirga rizhaonensis]
MRNKNYLLIPIIALILSLNSCMNQKPSDSRLKKLFESFTKCEFPKSGRIIDKNNLSGLNDGWEVAIVKVEDTIEFKQLANNIYKNKETNKRLLGKYGFGFSSKLANEKASLMDSVHYKKESFILGFIKNENLIVFEKE